MKKYFLAFLALLVIPFCLQLVLVDNSSFKWAHFRWYLIISVLFVYVLSKFEYKKSFLTNFTLMYATMGISVAATYKFIKKTQLNGEFLWDELTTSIAILGVLYSVFFAFQYRKINISKIFSVIEILLLVPYLANIGYAVVEHDCITANSLIAIYQTNPVEIWEFMKATAPLYTYGFEIFFLIILFLLLYKTLKNTEILNKSISKKEIIFLVIIFISAVFIGNKTFKDSYFSRIALESNGYLKSVKAYNEYRLDASGKSKYIEARTTSADNETYLVVIGESQNRKHMSAYGYSRDTTPWLKAQLNNKNFVVMENGYACNTLTMLALSQALTEKSQYNHRNLETSYSLVDIAKAAGFKTYWISNQAQFGSFNTPITLIADSADERIWLNSDSSAGSSYDEKILPILKNIRGNERKIIFIHLYGNHWEYKHRYPKGSFDKYDGQKVAEKVVDLQKLNEYDNSIYYNDTVVKEIFNYAVNNWNLCSMVYFSDHGEAVKSNNKHIPSKYEDDMGTVPVYWYFSDEYRRKHLDLVKFAQLRKEVYFTNDMMYNALLNVWRINTPYYDAKEDFLSEKYGYKKEDLLILDEIKISK